MKYRKLRIVWSGAWGVVAVLLLALWVRSYWGEYGRRVLTTSTDDYSIYSSPGGLFFSRNIRVYPGFQIRPGFPKNLYGNMATALGFGIVGDAAGNVYSVKIPFWLLSTIPILLAAFPWLRYRFSLRTLLLATTLIAVVMGMAVYLLR